MINLFHIKHVDCRVLKSVYSKIVIIQKPAVEVLLE